MRSMKILEKDTILLTQPLLIERFGRVGAQFLSQLHYWLNHSRKVGVVSEGVKWIFNSAKDWAGQLRVSGRTVQRLTRSLSESGVLKIKKLSADKYDRTNYYAIDYAALERIVGSEPLKRKPAENSITPKRRNATRQNDATYIQKLPTKELNKSEDSTKTSGVKESSNDFERVENEKNSIERSGVGGDAGSTGAAKAAPKSNTARAMLEIWNETLGEKAKATMSKELAPLLVSAYNSKFAKDLEGWKRYVSLIESSAYLMGEKFVLSIFWALKFSTIDRIEAGEFGVKEKTDDSERGRAIATFEEVKILIDRIDRESREALNSRHKILEAIGVGEYLAWFHRAKFLEGEDGRVFLQAHNAYAETVWKREYDWVTAGV